MTTDPSTPQTPLSSANSGEAARPDPVPARAPLSLRRPVPGSHRRHFTSGSAESAVSETAGTTGGATGGNAGIPAAASQTDASVATSPPPPPPPPAVPEPAAASQTDASVTTNLPSPVARDLNVPGSLARPSGKPRRETGIPTEELRVSLPPKPSRRDKLSADLEQELADALGGQSLDSLLGGVAPATTEILEAESRRRAQVIRVHGDNVFFALDGRNEGVVSLRQFHTPPNPGEAFDVIVKGINPEDGLFELMVPGASIEVADWSDLSEGALVEARITGSNAGGLECEINKIRGFIPASQVGLYRVENLPDYVGQKLLCVVSEANPQRRNLVLSHRAVLERKKEDSRKDFLAGLEVGQTYEGTVRKIHDFGAFVDLGCADGLIHVSQLSWERVKHPSEVVQEGQKVQVRIEKFDPDTGKISLSLRNDQDNPWSGAEQRFPVGSMVHGAVTRIANFGAFVKIAPGVEGLVHITELAHYRVTNIGKVVREGQEVDVKILSVDPAAQRIALSLKAALPVSEPSKESGEEVAEIPRPLTVPRRPGPLKGGVDRSSAGDNHGLQWEGVGDR